MFVGASGPDWTPYRSSCGRVTFYWGALRRRGNSSRPCFRRVAVAERVGLAQPTIAGSERYDANPAPSTILRYAVAGEARLVTQVLDDCSAAWEADAVGDGLARVG